MESLFFIFICMWPSQLTSSNIQSEQLLLPISYAGITAECIPGTQNFYEIVWNCGSLAGLMTTLDDPLSRNRSLSMIMKIFEWIQQANKQIIFITDRVIYDTYSDILEPLFISIFGVENFAIKGVQTIWQDKNPINGLRVNRTGFTSDERLVAIMESLPNATVISSIPRSDPRLDGIKERIPMESKLRESFAFRTLWLLDLNAKKSNQESIGWTSMGFLWKVNNFDELQVMFSDFPDQKLVLKEDAGSAWWTNVNFIGNSDQRSSILKASLIFPVLIYTFLEPTLIQENRTGWQYPIQFRPFFMSDGSFAGWCLKIPNEPIQNDGFINWWWKSSFAKQNRSLNTSSGLCNSFFVDSTGDWVSGHIVTDGWFQIIDGSKIESRFMDYSLVKSNKPIWSEEFMIWANNMQPLIRSIQFQTNQTLWLM